MTLVRTWFAEHPPSAWIVVLEAAVRVLNWVLLALGAAVAVWSVITVVQIQSEPAPPPPAPPAPGPAPFAAHTAAAAWSASALHAAASASAGSAHEGATRLHDVPWFIWAFGALGAVTGLTAGTALLGIRLRSPGCMSSHVFCMCLLLTGQACCAAAFFMDKAWQQRLPEIDEKLKALLAQRLQVCKWVGVGLLLLQLLELLLSCSLQSVYVGAEEAAEDADEEAAFRFRRPLLHQQQQQQQPHARQGRPSGSAGGGSGSGAAGAADEAEVWRERMQQQYGLDTSQFSYASEGGGQRRQGEGGSRSCSIM